MVDLQPFESFLDKRKKQGESKGLVFPENSDVAIGGVRKLNAAMLVFDIAESSKYTDQEFVDYISPFLHQAFHIVNNHNGIVDKYTGDGAMISYCDKGMSDQKACIKALETALDLTKITEILIKKYSFPKISIRIGIDFGPIKVERIGVRGKTELIIVGSSATSAKRLETLGKLIDYHHNSTICIGYDIYYNLSDKRKKFCKELNIQGDLKNFYDKQTAFFNDKKPYLIYEYKGRYKDE